MTKKDDVELSKVAERKDELEMVLKWKIVPKIDIVDKYRVTIAYGTNLANSKNIRVLGSFKGVEIPTKIIEFFDEFLQNVSCFGLLVESTTTDDVRNWEITFSKLK